MKSYVRIAVVTGVACFIAGGGTAVWMERAVANAASPQTNTTTPAPAQTTSQTTSQPPYPVPGVTTKSMSEKNDQHVKIADRKMSYIASVTAKNALKVDGSGVTQPVQGVKTNGVSGDLPENTSTPDLGYPRQLTLCWNADLVTVQESTDGKTWYPDMVQPIGTTIPIISYGEGCVDVPPARYVKWVSKDFLFQRADGMYQASY